MTTAAVMMHHRGAGMSVTCACSEARAAVKASDSALIQTSVVGPDTKDPL